MGKQWGGISPIDRRTILGFRRRVGFDIRFTGRSPIPDDYLVHEIHYAQYKEQVFSVYIVHEVWMRILNRAGNAHKAYI